MFLGVNLTPELRINQDPYGIFSSEALTYPLTRSQIIRRQMNSIQDEEIRER